MDTVRGAPALRRALLVGAIAFGAALPAPAAPAAARREHPSAPQRIVETLPAEVEVLAAQERTRRSNIMFAQLVTDPYKGYEWAVTAFKASPSAKTLLAVHFAQSAASDTQHRQSSFSWTLPAGALRMDRDLKPASLVTKRGMGNNGSISMELDRAGRYLRGNAPQGCSGSISYRLARFSGRLAINLRDQYFKKIGLRRARVLLYREHDVRCSPSSSPSAFCPDHLSLEVVDEESGVVVGAFRTEEGKVDQVVVATGKSGDADARHTISVTLAMPEAFEASDDLTTASVDGDPAAPWLSGDLNYIAPPPPTEGVDEDCGPYQSTSGVVTGDFTAYFDPIGPVTPASTGLPATLRREGA
ncbi:MAG: hypothetical protein M3271_05375 [Actinomycetota bacterium]|nr:hypothetical protein [Actinomycetota bacterium]